MAQLERDTRVGRLRIRAAADDALALAMRGEAALRPLDLRPPGMPRRAILCIRRMDDPLPRAIDLRTAHPPRATEWERAARGVIAEAFRRAVRVRDGVVPANADVIVFDDRAVLLAAAARDAVRGRLDEWYWKKILRGATLEAVLHEWQRDVTYVAAAIELLADDVVAFIRSIESTRAAALAAALVQSTRPPQLPPQWRALAPEAALAALNEEQRTLMAIALILRRAPDVLRAEHAPQQPLRTPRRESADVPKERKRLSRYAVTTNGEVAQQPGSNSAVIPEQTTAAPMPQPGDHAVAETRNRATAQPRDRATAHAPDDATAQPRNRAAAHAPDDAAAQPRNRAAARDDTAISAARNPQPATSHEKPAASESRPATVEAIHSTHAGAFFLLNVVEWKYLRLAARMLVPSIEEDGVWPLLGVARRQRAKLPRHPLTPVPRFARNLPLPLRGRGPGVWTFSAAVGGMRSIAPGFSRVRAALMNQARVAGDRFTSARISHPARSCRPLHGLNSGRAAFTRLKPGAIALEPPTAARRPEEILRALRTLTRVRRALATRKISPELLIAQRGTIVITPAHLDVTFSLERHPIEIRMAGLDRDPGWIAATGRHVAFHFD